MSRAKTEACGIAVFARAPVAGAGSAFPASSPVSKKYNGETWKKAASAAMCYRVGLSFCPVRSCQM